MIKGIGTPAAAQRPDLPQEGAPHPGAAAEFEALSHLMAVRQAQSEVEVLAARRLLDMACRALDTLQSSFDQEVENLNRARDQFVERHCAAPVMPRALRAWSRNRSSALDTIARLNERLVDGKEEVRRAGETVDQAVRRHREIRIRQEKFDAALQWLRDEPE